MPQIRYTLRYPIINDSPHNQTTNHIGNRVDRNTDGRRAQGKAGFRNQNRETGEADDVHGGEESHCKEEMPISAGLKYLIGLEALQLGSLHLRGIFLAAPALGDIAHGCGLHTDGRHNANHNDRNTDDQQSSLDTHRLDQTNQHRCQEGSGAAVESHTQSGGQAPLIGVPAGGAVSSAGVDKAHADALQHAESDVQHPGRTLGHKAGQQERQPQQNAAGHQRCFSAGLAQHPTAEDVAGGLHECHEGRHAGNGLRRPAVVGCQGGNEHRRGVQDAAHEQNNQCADQYAGTVHSFCVTHILILLSNIW